MKQIKQILLEGESPTLKCFETCVFAILHYGQNFWRIAIKNTEAVAGTCSVNNGVIKHFTKFTEKQLCQSFFFNKVASLCPATLLKKRLWHRFFSVSFAKFSRKPFPEHFWWLLLKTSSFSKTTRQQC